MKKMDFKTLDPIIWVDTRCVIDKKNATNRKPLPPAVKLLTALDYLATKEHINICFIDVPDTTLTLDALYQWHEKYTPERVKTGHIIPAPDGITDYLRVRHCSARRTDILISNDLTELGKWDKFGGTSLHQSDVLLKMIPFSHMPKNASSEQSIAILKQILKEVTITV